jgi:MerR family copper efflux transcriptional regulator
MKGEPIPIACTLTGSEVATRVDEWRAVVGRARQTQARPGGVRLEFDRDAPVDELARLMAAEQSCCQFFSFALTVDGRGVGLEVSAPDDGQAILAELFGP